MALAELDRLDGLGAHFCRGRVVASDEPDQATSIATLLDKAAPFDDPRHWNRIRSMLSWLQEVEALKPDLVLLDYGAGIEDPGQ